MSTPDPTIEEIRQARWRISEQLAHDPARLVEHYIQLQAQHRDRLLPLPKRAESDEALAERSRLLGAG
jgi:hypothetical protein